MLSNILYILFTNIYFQVFKRTGNDLIIRINIELVEALCGFQKVIRTLDDRDIVITVLPGEVTKHGEVKCVLNEGKLIRNNNGCHMHKINTLMIFIIN